MKGASTDTVEPTSLRTPESAAVLHNAGARASIASLWKELLSAVQHKRTPHHKCVKNTKEEGSLLIRPLCSLCLCGEISRLFRRGNPLGCRGIIKAWYGPKKICCRAMSEPVPIPCPALACPRCGFL